MLELFKGGKYYERELAIAQWKIDRKNHHAQAVCRVSAKRDVVMTELAEAVHLRGPPTCRS